jgi:uncharacterized coiled-coil protein SlyX
LFEESAIDKKDRVFFDINRLSYIQTNMLSNCANCGSGFYGNDYGGYCCALCESLDRTPELEERINQLEITVDALAQEINDLKKIIKKYTNDVDVLANDIE